MVQLGRGKSLDFGLEQRAVNQTIFIVFDPCKVHLWEDLGPFYLEKSSKGKNITWTSSLSSS